MRTIFTFFILVLTSYSILAKTYLSTNQIGFWYNENTRKTIEVINFGNGLKVKGLKNDIQWVRFNRTKKNIYHDKFGNALIIHLNRIVIVNPYRSRKLTFFPLNHKPDLINENSCCNPTNENENNLLHGGSLEGSWKVDGITKIVYITNTRDGIKARFSDNNLWYSYQKNGTTKFISDEGHSYNLIGQQLIWIDKTGTIKYYLSKISNEFGTH